MTRTTLLSALVCFVAVPLFSSAAAATPHPSVAPPAYADVFAKGGAQAVLEVTDQIHFGFGTQEVDAVLKIHEPGDKEGRRMRQYMHQDGQKRLIRILEPPEVKGMGILIKDSQTMYVYVPEMGKVRRVASHARKQTFLGSDYNFEDMGMSELAPKYDAVVESETADAVVLMLTKKADADVPYPKLRLTVSKKNLQMTKQEYFDEDGRHVRTQERWGMKSFEDKAYAVQTQMKMTDHANHDHWTELEIVSWKVNHTIPSKLFKKRTLVRGE